MTPAHRLLLTRSVSAGQAFEREVRSLIAGSPLESGNVELLYAPIQQAELAPAGKSDFLASLGAGAYRWVSFTSANGVLALEKLVEEKLAQEKTVWADSLCAAGVGESRFGSPLAILLAGVRVACVGAATARVLEERGVAVDFTPSLADAAHMLQQWPEDSASLAENERGLLCIQGTNARPTLSRGLEELGWQVEVENIYTMSPYPAQQPLTADEDPANLTLARALENLPAVSLVVATAPSLLTELVGSWRASGAEGDFPPVVAIGASTLACAQKLGLRVTKSPGTSPQDLARTSLALLTGEKYD